MSGARVDSWITAVRLVRTRALAATACKAGHVRVNGERAKPAQALRVGDEVRVRTDAGERVVVVAKLIARRVSAPDAAECYLDRTPPAPPKTERVVVGVRDRGAGRPTKRDRRKLERFLDG